MGMRHQIFVKTINPLHLSEIDNEVSNKVKQLRLNALFSKELGLKETTVLAYHNQWLYGVSATANALQVLTISKYSNEYNNPFNKTHWKNNRKTPKQTIELFIQDITNVQNICSSDLYKEVGCIGLGSSWYLNKQEPIMREHWNCGDNNDGCTIIDTTTNKYCFIVDWNHKGLKKHTPYSAAQYVAVYYPNTETSLKKYYIEQDQKNAIGSVGFKSELISNQNLVNKVKVLFEEFELLTIEEVKEMFPKVYQKKTKK